MAPTSLSFPCNLCRAGRNARTVPHAIPTLRASSCGSLAIRRISEHQPLCLFPNRIFFRLQQGPSDAVVALSLQVAFVHQPNHILRAFTTLERILAQVRILLHYWWNVANTHGTAINSHKTQWRDGLARILETDHCTCRKGQQLTDVLAGHLHS